MATKIQLQVKINSLIDQLGTASFSLRETKLQLSNLEQNIAQEVEKQVKKYMMIYNKMEDDLFLLEEKLELAGKIINLIPQSVINRELKDLISDWIYSKWRY